MSRRRRRSIRGALLLVLPTLGACGGGTEPAPTGEGEAGEPPSTALFTDVTVAKGFALRLTGGGPEPRQIVEVKGGGLGLLDYDNDGDLDLFAPNGATIEAPADGAGARLFANDGELAFRDVTAEAELAWSGWGMGVAAGDVDGDGWLDLFVAAFQRDALLMNRAGRFEETTDEAGLGDDGWGTGSALGDLDLDGDLDLYLVRYLALDLTSPPPPTTFLGVPVFDGPSGLTPLADRAYANDGGGRFRDVTAEYGFDVVAPSYGLGALILDLDEDGFQDVYVGNDSASNFLFFGSGDERRFAEAGLASGVAVNADGDTQATMGIAFGDVNSDGRPDLFSTNFMTDTNTLFASTGAPRVFTDRTQRMGLALVSRPYLGWAAWFGDFDLDADEDLVLFNGHVYPDEAVLALGSSSAQEPLLFLREDARFRRVLPGEGGPWLAAKHNDRSAVFADLDGDGDLDMAVAERNGPVRLLRGEARARTPERRGLVVRLRDARPDAKNLRGVGSRLALVDANGEVLARRWIAAGGSYLAACPPEVHFGLGADAGALAIEVRWPDGSAQRAPVSGGALMEIVRE